MRRAVLGLITKQEDGAEIVRYDDPSFPSFIFEGWIAPKVPWERVPHFHEDIEILTVQSGTMAYCVNGTNIVLHEGDSIVINANQIHYFMSLDGKVASYIIFVIHPSVLCTSISVEREAVRPIIENRKLPYLCFAQGESNSVTFADLAGKLPEMKHDGFAITRQFFQMWELIRKHSLDYAPVLEEPTTEAHMQAFKAMMYYASIHYRESITLDDIANAANISRSLCNALFKQYLNESPISYLMHFRTRQAAELLRASNYSQTQIAAMTGFNSASYLSETFRKFFGMTPREYKKIDGELTPELALAIASKK